MFSSTNRPLLERDFVLAKIDTDRYLGGQAILDQLCPKPGGIPWFVFLEPEAKPIEPIEPIEGQAWRLGAKALGDSNLMDGGNNVGSPYTAKEIAVFEALLQRVSRKLDAKALQTLHLTLLEQGEKVKK